MARDLLTGDRPFTLTQAEAVGISEAVVRRALRRDELQTVCRGLFLGSHVELDLPTRARGRPGAAGRGRVQPPDGSVLLGAGLDEPPELDVLLPPTSRGSQLPRTRSRTAGLPVADACRWDGLRVATPARTVLDLACTAPLLEALVAVDALAHVWPAALQDAVQRLPERAA